jgi:hypothetical protein
MRGLLLAALLCACDGDTGDGPSDTDTSVDSETDSDTTEADSDTQDVDSEFEPAPIGLAIELTWTLDIPGPMSGDDLDLHLLFGDAPIGHASLDCFWNNAQPNWGAIPDGTDDPNLTRDDTSGTGPERIEMAVAQDQSYRVVIVDSEGVGAGSADANEATVVIWVNDVETWRGVTTLTGDDSEIEMVSFNPVGATYSTP